MRLIDADEFILSLNDYIDKPITVGLCATLVHLFPTAYDIDKVVEELKNQMPFCPTNSFTEGVERALLDAIEIVKRGVR